MTETYPMAIVSAPGKVEFQEKRLPELSPKEVLIGVKASPSAEAIFTSLKENILPLLFLWPLVMNCLEKF